MITFDRNRDLTKDFKLGEFMISSSHPQALDGIVLTEPEIQKFYLLCLLCLQPTRDHMGALRITSAYRTPPLNRLVGGVDDSQHCLAEAVDFIPAHSSPLAVYYFIVDQLKWPGEVIYYEVEGRLHVALPRLGVRSDHFIKKGGNHVIST